MNEHLKTIYPEHDLDQRVQAVEKTFWPEGTRRRKRGRIASHNGSGMRPAEGLLSHEDQAVVIDTVRRIGGLVSMRSMTNCAPASPTPAAHRHRS